MNDRLPYSCASSEADRDRFLDGEPPDDLREYLDHLADCVACRSQHRAAIRMIEGLAAFPAIAPPPDLAARIFAAVQADRATPASRREVSSRRIAYVVAASLFVFAATGIGWFISPKLMKVTEGVVHAPKREAPAFASAAPLKLKDRLSSAGSAFLARTQKATSKTIPNIPLSQALTTTAPRTANETLATIDQVGSGASSTIAPIASSTRRMFDLFRRELPALDPNVKPNS
jgi:hypothetical protein